MHSTDGHGSEVAGDAGRRGHGVGERHRLLGILAEDEPSPVTPADKAKGTPAVYGDTEAQAMSVITKIEEILKAEGLTLGDIVQMECFVAGDPAKGGKMDFAGLNKAYDKFFGTADQPKKPVRAAMQVAALATDWGLVEIMVVAVKGK